MIRANLKIEELFKWFLITLPFDSFPFPINFVYRPLVIIPILLITLFFSKNHLMVPKNIFLALIAISIISLFNSFFLGEYTGLKKFIFQIILIIITIHSINVVFTRVATERIIEITKKSVRLVLSMLVIIGTLQLIGRFFNPFQLLEKLNSLFAYRFDSSRIQFFSGEPSMGVRMVLLYICLAITLNDFKANKMKIIALILLILLSGSTFGILFLLLMILIYLLLSRGKNLIFTKEFGYFIVFLLAFSLLYPYLISILPQYARNKISYIPQILSELSLDKILLIASNDGSFFLRLFNPIIAFNVFMDNWILGVGGENFQYHYMNVIQTNYSFAESFETIQKVKDGSISITPKSLVLRIAAEFGLLGVIFLIIYYYNLIKTKSFPWIRTFLIVVVLNYDSYIYIPLIFLLVFFFFLKSIDGSLKNSENN